MFHKKLSQARKEYKCFTEEDIGRETAVIKENLKAGLVRGDNDFFEMIRDKYITGRDDSEIPVLRVVKKEPTLEQIKQIVEKKLDDKKLQRKLGIYLSRKYTQRTLNEIARFYGNLRDTGVSQVFLRTQTKRNEDRKFQKLLLSIEQSINV